MVKLTKEEREERLEALARQFRQNIEDASQGIYDSAVTLKDLMKDDPSRAVTLRK